MIKNICVLFLVVACVDVYSSITGNAKSSYDFIVLSETQDGMAIKVKLNGYVFDTVRINAELANNVVLDKATTILRPGYPNIPRIVKGLAVPENADVKLEVTVLSYEEIKATIAPCPEIRKRNSMAAPKYFYSEVYNDDSFYPESSGDLSESYMIRDQKGVNLYIMPFQYNPVKRVLRVNREMVVKLSFVSKSQAYKSAVTNRRSKVFDQIFQHNFINSSRVRSLSKAMDISERDGMLVIAPAMFMQAAQVFVNHKIQKGFDVDLVSLSSIGTTHEHIKTYIDNYYATHENFTYLVLVGDYEQIPSPLGWNPYPLPPRTPVGWYPQDPKYSLISGSDNYPDIIVGRLSGETELQIQRIISKTMYYENDLIGGAWTRTALGLAISGYYEGPGDDGEYDWEHIRNIHNEFLSSYYFTIYEGFEGSRGGLDAPGDPTSSWILARINEGVSLINYSGHGHYDGWYFVPPPAAYPMFCVVNSNVFLNFNKLPFVFSVACNVGGFRGRSCFAEHFLRGYDEAEMAPTGAIGFYGSADELDWNPPMEAQDEFNRMIISGENISYGALCFNASIRMLQAYPNHVKNFDMWAYFGDPSVLSIMSHGDCPENDLVQTDVTSGSHSFTANNSLIANNTISGTASVFMGANHSVRLSPGFWVQNGAALEVNNIGCMVSAKRNEHYSDSVNTGQNVSLDESIIMYPVSPNPFNPSAVIKFNVKKDSEPSTARLDIFSLSGRLIRTYSIQLNNSGVYSIVWDAKDMANMKVSAGIYLVRLNFNGSILKSKLTYVR